MSKMSGAAQGGAVWCGETVVSVPRPTSSPFESPWVLGAGSHRIASTLSLNFRVMCVSKKSPRALGLGSTVKADGGRTVKNGNAGFACMTT